MKLINYILLSLLIFFSLRIYSQENILCKDNIEIIIKDIKNKYKIINSNKENYTLEFEEYDSSHDDMENGNDNIDIKFKRYKYFKNDRAFLIVNDSITNTFPSGINYKLHYELYFWDNQLFFCFSREKFYVFEPVYRKERLDEGEDIYDAIEKRIYIFNGKPIRYLEKKISGSVKLDDKKAQMILNNTPNKKLVVKKSYNNDWIKAYLKDLY